MKNFVSKSSKFLCVAIPFVTVLASGVLDARAEQIAALVVPAPKPKADPNGVAVDGTPLDPRAGVDADDGMPPIKGRLVLKSMPRSRLLNRKITTWVYLPPDYDTGNARYPVVYLLHGVPGYWTDWYRSGSVQQVADELIVAGKIAPMILVAFDGNGPGGNHDRTQFCNRATDGYNEEDFMARELVSYIDRTYNTIATPAARCLMGYSGGGYGALNAGFHHPNVWNVLVSHSGFYQPEDDKRVMTAVLGEQSTHADLWDANNPMKTVHALPARAPLHVYMDDSTNGKDFAKLQSIVAALQSAGIDYTAPTFPMSHTWGEVHDHSYGSLAFVSRAFGIAKTTGAAH